MEILVLPSRDSFLAKLIHIISNPGFGYQFGNNWTAGINIAVGGGRQETGNTGNYNTTSFSTLYSISSLFMANKQCVFSLWTAEVNYLSGTKTSPYQLVRIYFLYSSGLELISFLRSVLISKKALRLIFLLAVFLTRKLLSKMLPILPINSMLILEKDSSLVSLKIFGPKKEKIVLSIT